jgi:hypothetical protein
MLAVVGDGVEIEIEGAAGKQGGARGGLLPGGQELGGHRVIDPRGVLREVAPLGDGVESGEERQALIGHEGHDVTLVLDRPELEGQRRPQRVGGRNHPRAGQPRGLGQVGEVEPNELRDEQEQAAAAGLEPPGRQRERARIGHGLDRRLGASRPFLVQAAGQGREPLGFEHLPHRRRAERELALLQRRADLIDRVVPLAQGDDGVAGGGLLGLGARPTPRGGEEDGRRLAPEVMAHDMEGPPRVAEGPGHLGDRPLVDVVRAQGLVLALLRRGRLQEEPPTGT